MKEIIRDGLRFPTENADYEVPPEVGEELVRRNQELMSDADCATPKRGEPIARPDEARFRRRT